MAGARWRQRGVSHLGLVKTPVHRPTPYTSGMVYEYEDNRSQSYKMARLYLLSSKDYAFLLFLLLDLL